MYKTLWLELHIEKTEQSEYIYTYFEVFYWKKYHCPWFKGI